MSNQELIDKFRLAEFPTDLSELLERLIQAADALRPVYPAEFLYQVNFAERTILREVLEPDERAHHWWQTGLYIIRQGLAEHQPPDPELDEALDELFVQLEARLGPYDEVSLREIDSDSVNGICLLSELMTYPQTTFVAPNAWSLAQALFHATAWYRAIYAGKAPVGFIMLDDNAVKSEYYLWRFMIAPQFQRHGFGAKAIELLVDYVKARPGAKELRVSYIDHEAGAGPFYRRQGFKETGKVDEGEVEMLMEL
jgi:diamine N-acetyltransferase